MGPKCHNMCTYCTSTLILSTLNLSVLNRTDMTLKTTVVQVLLINFRICNVFNLEICIFILTICHNEENSALGESRLWRVKNFSTEGKKIHSRWPADSFSGAISSEWLRSRTLWWPFSWGHSVSHLPPTALFYRFGKRFKGMWSQPPQYRTHYWSQTWGRKINFHRSFVTSHRLLQLDME